MRTLLSRFCEEFVDRLRPLLQPLTRCAEGLRDAPRGVPGTELEGDVQELRHQLGQLIDKVHEQQAYVVIFGPLKSGKSTLMNAIAGSYVSEVSALPAYPCLVFVSHADARRFSITRYDGVGEDFADPTSLEQRIDHAHDELAERIRRVEASGGSFDPQQHFLEAIRRVDVRLPAGDLRQSNAVLVDTPGLYSRMRFGYDRLTRDFRNAAACAVFVVRSDNLFLDHVFDEFERLLELFSRIFLIVNVDTGKLDLQADGSLAPSLEQRDPERILAAFERLAMSASLKAATDDGRLRIYPVDLLRAASRRIRSADDGGDSDRFDSFVADLTRYLESPDYLLAFLGDSLRRAKVLLEDCHALSERPALAALGRRLGEVRAQLQDRHARLAAVERLAAQDWHAAFAALRADLGPSLTRWGESCARDAKRTLDQAIQQWASGDASLHDLTKGEVAVVLTRYQEELTAAASRELAERLIGGDGGLQMTEAAVADLQRAGIDLGAIGRSAHQRADRAALIRVVPTPLRSDALPVRRRAVDWLLLRRAAALRERLFGPAERPDRRIPPKVKEQRLGAQGVRELRQRVESFRTDFCRETTERIRSGFLDGYCATAIRDLSELLEARRAQLQEQINKLAGMQQRCEAVLGPVAELRAKAGIGVGDMAKLSAEYGKVDADALMRPAETRMVLPRPEGAAAPEPKAPAEVSEQVSRE